MVYFPQRTLGWSPDALGMAYEEVWLTTTDNVRLYGWFIPAPEARGTILYFHGNGSNIGGVMWDAGPMHQMQMNVLFIDYRGYGRSEGTPSERGLYADAAAAWRYLTDTRGIPPDTIIIMGHSLGGAVGAQLAERYTPAALVLMSSFTRMTDVGAAHYPFLPVRQLSRNHYPTIERLPNIDAPILFSHGRSDTVVPFYHSEKLYAAASEPKTFLPMEGGHGRGFASLTEQYPAEIEAFFDRVLPPVPAEP
jgi:hypothetical protein